MKMKLILILCQAVIEFAFSLVCVALGWNVFLTKLFDFVPVLGFGKLCILTLAIDFLAVPANIGGAMKRNDILKAVRGKE